MDWLAWLPAGPLTCISCTSRFQAALGCCGELSIFRSSSVTLSMLLLLSPAAMPARWSSTSCHRRPACLAMLLLRVLLGGADAGSPVDSLGACSREQSSSSRHELVGQSCFPCCCMAHKHGLTAASVNFTHLAGRNKATFTSAARQREILGARCADCPALA